MGPIVETWLQETEEGQAYIVHNSEAAFYMGQRQMQYLLYAKLRLCFSSFSISRWRLPEVLPLQQPSPALVPTSSSLPASAFLISLEWVRARFTLSIGQPLL